MQRPPSTTTTDGAMAAQPAAPTSAQHQPSIHAWLSSSSSAQPLHSTGPTLVTSTISSGAQAAQLRAYLPRSRRSCSVRPSTVQATAPAETAPRHSRRHLLRCCRDGCKPAVTAVSRARMPAPTRRGIRYSSTVMTRRRATRAARLRAHGSISSSATTTTTRTTARRRTTRPP